MNMDDDWEYPHFRKPPYGGFLSHRGYPQIIHFSRIFHYKSSVWGKSILGNLHMMEQKSYDLDNWK